MIGKTCKLICKLCQTSSSLDRSWRDLLGKAVKPNDRKAATWGIVRGKTSKYIELDLVTRLYRFTDVLFSYCGYIITSQYEPNMNYRGDFPRNYENV